MSPKPWIESKPIKSNSNSHGDTMISNMIPKGSGRFGHWIINEMNKRDITIRMMAVKMDVAPNSIRKWIIDPKRMKIKTLIEMGDIIDPYYKNEWLQTAIVKINKNNRHNRHNRGLK